jgi:hypothetical protein
MDFVRHYSVGWAEAALFAVPVEPCWLYSLHLELDCWIKYADSIAAVGAAEDSTLDIAYFHGKDGCRGRKDSLEGFGWLVES